MSEKQLSFDGAMKIVGEEKWILIKDIKRLEKFIQNQQAIISALKKENGQLKKELDNYIPVMFQDIRKGNVILYFKCDY